LSAFGHQSILAVLIAVAPPCITGHLPAEGVLFSMVRFLMVLIELKSVG
jgi:hypothetical protein